LLNVWRRLPLAGKIVLPYLLLTLLVGVGGTFLTARIVAGSANERLTGALVEAARRADAELLVQEEARLRALDALGARTALVEAVARQDRAAIGVGLAPAPAGVDWATAIDAQGRSLAGEPATLHGSAVETALRGAADAAGVRRGGLLELTDGPSVVAITPLRDGDRVVGALAVGQRAGSVAAALKRVTLTDVALYGADGRPLATTLPGDAPPAGPPVVGEPSLQELEVDGRAYRVLAVPFRVRGESVGTLAVALPAESVERVGGQTRDELALLFAGAMIAAVLVGLLIAGRIARPIRTLARTARALGAGDLGQRSGLRGPDEIGALGATFDAMADDLAQREAQLRESYLKAMRALALAVDAKDPYTHGHSQRVSAYAVMLARQLGLDEATLAEIEMGGLLHDVGKIGVPDSVLTKPGKLDDDEWAAIKKHPEIGAEILRPIGFTATVMDVVLHHHERLNGRGFPAGLRGEAIPLAARIAAVCDAYDAMTSDRSYRRSLGQAGALDELRKGAGEQFDAACVEAFVAALAASSPLVEPAEVAVLDVRVLEP
jgi:putative nucleotidyltransferase with HDIG domain